MAYEICFSRPPEEDETRRALAFLERVRASGSTGTSESWPPSMGEAKVLDERLHAWRNLCQVLMASNEFIYIH